MSATDQADIDRQRAHWKYRAVAATHGNQSQLGAILLACIKQNAKNPPRFLGKAIITSDSYVMCNFEARDGRLHVGAFVGSVRDLVDNFRGLADHLNLTTDERGEMFLAVRNWVMSDFRDKRPWFD